MIWTLQVEVPDEASQDEVIELIQSVLGAEYSGAQVTYCGPTPSPCDDERTRSS